MRSGIVDRPVTLSTDLCLSPPASKPESDGDELLSSLEESSDSDSDSESLEEADEDEVLDCFKSRCSNTPSPRSISIYASSVPSRTSMSTRDESVSICRLSASFDASISERNALTLGSKLDEGGISLIWGNSGSMGPTDCAAVLLVEGCEFNDSKRRPM